MGEGQKLDSVGIHQVRPECVDWGHKSASPVIRQLADHLSFLLAEAREYVPGPASEVISEVEETTASGFANETNRVLRLTVNCAEGPVEFDVVLQLAAPTSFVFSEE
ncbi:hypothetical protein J7I94_37085 [Streptomyces sp. ISL-12]|uniref:hypothetical protein n=1 Tax=Streptomyces sp. ISL-12 TaxID=2819177 RepID=UPI001BE90531|nr:hypothetical protein [Streptomyces sp. ISL-12]MBT2416076.1 hypothetical protein [Streptomyces sp. ISL-12]